MVKTTDELLQERQGIRLDIGCGENKQPGFVGLDKRSTKGVDIVHDLEVFPYPLPDGCCLMIMGSHIVEHINPAGGTFLRFMEELWRIMKMGGQLAFSHPFGVNSLFVQDPTHCNPCNQATWQYFDPRYPLYDVYKPCPWELEKGFPVWQVTGNMEVLFNKISYAKAEKLFAETKKKYFDGGNGEQRKT